MSKAFVKESEEAEELEFPEVAAVAGFKNYMTPAGYRALREEFEHLVKVERPRLVEVVAWAAGNGDRSENGDYIYGKRRLREIDRRIRYLTKRLESAEVVDPAAREATDRVYFGATVTVYDVATDTEETWQIVGVDEANPSEGKISWISPLAKALLKRAVGDEVRVPVPGGVRVLEIVDVQYRA
ncbi:transcription elongation factor GreB [Hydrogenophilus thiooxidans]|uniref:transcription elongation factor GreB n=1 Tax=Hydrogenophilus thiooxidans TaxID=2820326 RepID=UPI001C229EE1|nr:transcription elongation factor GreB [Hydrogenophilus thiooxidans]